MGEAIYKVPDGKLLRLSAEFDGKKIVSATIRGDFFLHPEQGIEAIEAALVGKKLDKSIVGILNSTIAENSLELFGFDSEAVFEALKMAKVAKNG